MPLDNTQLKAKYDATKCAWKHCRAAPPEPLGLFSRLPDGREIWLCQKHWAAANEAPQALPAAVLATPADIEVGVQVAQGVVVPAIPTPAPDKFHARLQQEAADAQTALEQWQNFSIDSENEYVVAGEILQDVKRRYKTLEEEKQSLLKPFNEGVKNLRDVFAVPQKFLSALETLLKARVAEYVTRLQKQKEEALRAIDQAKNSEQVTQALVQLKAAAEPEKLNGVSSREILDFEIADESLLPREYLSPNVAKIRAALSAGIQVPGVRTFSRVSIAVRTAT